MQLEKVLVVAAALALPPAHPIAAPPLPLAPLPKDQAVSTHGPFEMGSCEACHLVKSPAAAAGEAPGPVTKRSNQLCFECHDDYAKPMKGHPSPEDGCLTCHSPHNARKKKLLLR